MKYSEAGRLIEEARKAAGLNKRELAERVSISPSMISKMEAGKVFITPEVFRKLTTALRALSPVDLVVALGYEVTVPGEDRLPPPLVTALLRLDTKEREYVTGLVQRKVRPAHLQDDSPQ